MKRWLVVLAACGDNAGPEPWPFELPAGFPEPGGPRPTPELAELGRHLFYDVRLSGNGTQACASCHEQARAFTDGRVTTVGSTGEPIRRNSMSLANAAYNATQTWANSALVHLEQQAEVPMFGTAPVELGIAGNEDVVLGRLRDDATYRALFAAAGEPIEMAAVIRALAAFERRLISGNAPIDKHRRGELVLSDAALRGEALFSSERLQCARCHGGFNFSLAVEEPMFFNTGLYLDYPDEGLYEITGLATDRGAFRPPTLRNILVTAPYMHDGSVATMFDVLEIYERGGRGDGNQHPNRSPLLQGFSLSGLEHDDLQAFFEALTDEDFLTDPALASPF